MAGGVNGRDGVAGRRRMMMKAKGSRRGCCCGGTGGCAGVFRHHQGMGMRWDQSWGKGGRRVR